LFGYFLDPEDPDDGGWFPVDAVQFVGEADAPNMAQLQPTMSAASSPEPSDDIWNALPLADNIWNAPPPAAATASAHAAESRDQEPHAEAVEGLTTWLKGLSLQQYQERAIEWCQEMGALDVNEIEEEWEDFADALSLKRLERNRLSRAVAASRQGS